MNVKEYRSWSDHYFWSSLIEPSARIWVYSFLKHIYQIYGKNSTCYLVFVIKKKKKKKT